MLKRSLNMKVVLLAGGFGSRISEESVFKPKPMIEIGGMPILWHIMNHYAHYGYKDFVVALGYKGEVIKEYFLQYHARNSNLMIDLSQGSLKYMGGQSCDWRVTLTDTGASSQTGGRLLRLKDIIGNEDFMMTYGDAVSDININHLVSRYRQSGCKAMVTAVHPAARFGELQIDHDGYVRSFKEKPQVNQGWINGGFFVLSPDVFNYIDNDQTVFEADPLVRLCAVHGHCQGARAAQQDVGRRRGTVETLNFEQ